MIDAVPSDILVNYDRLVLDLATTVVPDAGSRPMPGSEACTPTTTPSSGRRRRARPTWA